MIREHCGQTTTCWAQQTVQWILHQPNASNERHFAKSFETLCEYLPAVPSRCAQLRIQREDVDFEVVSFNITPFILGLYESIYGSLEEFLIADKKLSQSTENETSWHSTHDMSLSPTEADMAIALHNRCLGTVPCYYTDKRADITVLLMKPARTSTRCFNIYMRAFCLAWALLATKHLQQDANC